MLAGFVAVSIILASVCSVDGMIVNETAAHGGAQNLFFRRPDRVIDGFNAVFDAVSPNLGLTSVSREPWRLLDL